MRHEYDLSHIIQMCGQIGRLQTLAVIPVVADDSIKIEIDAVFRLAPTRKEIVSECQVDWFAFFVPHRHTMGANWPIFLKEGVDEAVTFTGINVAAAYRNPVYLGHNACGATIPSWLVQGYNRIWDRYFRVPSIATSPEGAVDPTNYDFYPTNESGADNWRLYGKLCARLPHVLNGGNAIDATGVSGESAPWRDLTNADAQVSTAGSILDIRSLAEMQARYRTEVKNTWFAHFYKDILNEHWGTMVNIDADQRPEHLWTETFNMSGKDIDGTDDATLGSMIGKTAARGQFHMPMKHFNEHGAVWVMALLRFPLIHADEMHPLMQQPNPTADFILAQPDRWENMQPIGFDPAPWLSITSSLTPDATVLQPFGQHYRFQPNRVHPNFKTIPGYPFLTFNSANIYPWYYYVNEEYSDVFQTWQMGHWQIAADAQVTKLSRVPTPLSSIFAGAK